MLSRGNERVKDLQSRLEDEKLAFPLRQPQSFLVHLDSTIPYCILFTKKFRLNDSEYMSWSGGTEESKALSIPPYQLSLWRYKDMQIRTTLNTCRCHVRWNRGIEKFRFLPFI